MARLRLRRSHLAGALAAALLLGACRRGGPGGAPQPVPVPGEREPPVLHDLLSSRPLALVYEDDALVIDAATPDIYKFTDGGWKAALLTGERDLGDRRVALADGLVAVLRVPVLPPPGAAQLQLWLKPAPDAPQQAMTVLLNERPLLTLPLQAGYQRYRVPVPGGRLTVGENQLRLFFRQGGRIGERRSAAALLRVSLGPQAEAPAEPPPRAGRAGSYAIGADARPALIAARPTRWSYLLVPPAGPAPRLVLSVGTQTGAQPAAWTLAAARDGEPPRELRREAVEPGRWREVEVDLGPLFAQGQGGRGEGAALRLDLGLTGPGALARPRLLGATPPAEAAAIAAPPRAEHVVVFAVDALRADRLARPGGAFARLLGRGVRLEASAVSNYPLPAHASLLSGTYPAVHGLLRDAGAVPRTLPLLQELLGRAGFATGLFSGSGYVSERWGLSRGFDATRNLVREGLPSSSPEVWKLARPWLEAQIKAGRRVFLYLATADPHAPYTPPPGFQPPPALRSYAGPLRGGVSAQHLLQIRQGKLRPSPQDRAYLEALYDAEVAQTEATLGALLDTLERLGAAERTVVALVGTHGEELFDHGSVGHGHSLYRELTDVPLVLAFPARLPAGRALPLRAELLDLAPTLLHLAGAAVPEGVQGASLLPLLTQGGALWPRPALCQHGAELRALVLGRYKLILSSGDRVQLFDRLRDPGELHDVSTEHPVALRALRGSFALLHALERTWQKGPMGTAASLRSGL